MNITLRAGERRYLNGAVIRLDRKATIELLSDAAFLLETHVIQASEATTPLRQVYFVVQVMLMDPAAAGSTMDLLHQLIDKALLAFETPEIKAGLRTIVGIDRSIAPFRGDEIASLAVSAGAAGNVPERRNRRLASRLRGQNHDRTPCFRDHSRLVDYVDSRPRFDQLAQLR
jgi:flagellar protein FlbT